MARESMAIIGAGLAGLSAGCYAQMNGYRTHIFEHHAKPGGVAAWWERKGYLVDGGIHFLMGARPGQATYGLYRELGTASPDSLAEMNSYVHLIDEGAGRRLDITRDLSRLGHDLKGWSPRDGRVIDEMVAGARAMRRYDMGAMGLDEPRELSGVWGGVKVAWKMRPALKYFVGKYSRPVADYVRAIRDPWLRQLVVNLFLPEVPVWFVLSLLGMLAEGQMALLRGGCGDFVLSIEKRLKELGGEVAYNATVSEILVENDHAVGVRLADGSVHRADAVVSAADGYSTIYKLLGGRYLSESVERRYKDWRLIRPTVMVTFGVAREFNAEAPLNMIFLKDPIALGAERIAGFSLRIFNYGTRFAPPGKTVVQAMFETEWDYWSELRKEKPRYDAEKERVAVEVLKRLEPYYPGMSAQVEMTDVATPYTTWRYTFNHRGAYMGWLPTPQQIMARVDRTLPGLGDFYMAGQWVMPGGGVPACLYSGRHVVQMLCRKDGKRFSTSLP